ncbi:MAG: pseudaminic acid biosynthesis-associated methylase [Proteobacteria bacterium]|nr:pseudaminic acid biosynthesis-associated methylase [Pseudomonadota bacterium]
MNLKALKLPHPSIDLHAIEINSEAAKQLGTVTPPNQVHKTSILDFKPSRQLDLVLIKGVFIHINPEVLPQVYDKLFDACSRYLMVAEYYNPVPVAINYRGHRDRLFKRDFAGGIMDRHPQLQLIDYGFSYRRVPSFPRDDTTWFMMQKR